VQEVVFSLDICLICGETELSFSRLVAALSDIDGPVPLDDPGDKARVEAIVEIRRLWNCHSLFGPRPSDAGSRGVPLAVIERNGRTETTDIIGLVEKFRLYGCTDPRDRLFALFSMATNIRPVEHSTQTDQLSEINDYIPARGRFIISMNIDYSLDIRGTYETFALTCWKQKRMHSQIWEAVLSR
jgi:hypothetical protein